MTPNSNAIAHAYRHLLRSSYHAVRFAKPARYVLRDRLRTAFRTAPPTLELSHRKLDRTLEFLEGAASVNGYEHRLLRNLVQYWGQDMHYKPGRTPRRVVAEYRPVVQGNVDAMVNEMGRTLDIYL
ncbi:hypothetical protein C1H76_5492 [Elsinoe australis]|uniref:DUF1763-domain-containing protein n=1 Tax=Elsinoe australis TaxID=40998 RepID=A0A4U7B2U3_9PEZI|nr:hypothetical protein C1H76_5492 [Elsinoe australis]